MRDVDAAWLAGFLDGEGSFMVTRHERVSHDTVHFDAVVAATNTDFGLITRCQALAGGYVVSSRLKNPRCKLSYHWRLKGRAVGPLIEALLPYLVSKRAQAVLLLELRRITHLGSLPGRKGTKKTPTEMADREGIWHEVRFLNRRGVALPVEALVG